MQAPSLPQLTLLPHRCAIDTLSGFVFGQIIESNPSLMATIFAIRNIANTLFYHVANYAFKKSEIDSQKIFIFTSTMVDMIFLVALRELKLIGQLPSYLIGLAILGTLYKRVCYVQDEERQLILNQMI